MEKITKDIIISSIPIVIGIVSYFLKQFLPGTILIGLGIGVGSLNDTIRSSVWSFLKSLFSKSQSMDNSPGGIQQQSGRDSIVADVVQKAETIQNIQVNNQVENYSEKQTLKEVHKKMVKAMKLLNEVANIGLKNQEEFDSVSETIEDFIIAKMENAIEIDDKLMNKLDEVMGAFRYAKQQLYSRIQEKKFNVGLIGLRAFKFIEKCQEVTNEMKTILSK